MSPEQPNYDLTTVRRLALENKVSFKPRSDGKSNPANIRISMDEAMSILSRLSIRDYRGSADKKRRKAADVYITPYKRNGAGIVFDIYIKLAVIEENGERLLVISFHKA